MTTSLIKIEQLIDPHKSIRTLCVNKKASDIQTLIFCVYLIYCTKDG